jgi:hypothetical protein
MSRLQITSFQAMRRSGSGGFTNQQALLVLLICFPLGLIALGIIVILFQRQVPQLAQAPQSTPRAPSQPPTQAQQPDSGIQIQPLPNVPPPSDESGLTELQARSIVEKWLTVKSQIFAPPFNVDLANEVVAGGPLWTDLTKDDGSIKWLQNNNSYYTYSSIRINRVNGFTPSPSMPSIIVSITEDPTLHSPRGSSPSSSTRDWVYILKEEQGRWKIWDYRKQ